ncbi:protein FAM8A1 isoform X2 [Ambystoma mexicanum]|uniref:protein FAM8A1 isoform X2 n=1 Tax=Ambystoma mexicanum TaxID=8296 RepID=UPI0037E865F6
MGEAGAASAPPVTAQEYAQQVQEWLWQCYGGSLGWTPQISATGSLHLNPFYCLQSQMLLPPTPAWTQPVAAAPPATAPPQAREPARPPSAAGREFLIPSLVQRFIAELVDFFILFFIKAAVILSIMHFSGIRDISKFAMHYIIEEIDEDTSMEDLQKMMIVALIYRLLVCFYEIYNSSLDQEFFHRFLLSCLHNVAVLPAQQNCL